jgi:hypothetical protein
MCLRERLLLLITASSTIACVAAPAVRTSHYGAPGRMEAGMVEASGNVTWSELDISGGPMIGYGVTDAVAIEAGAEAGSLPRAIGYAGVRYTPLRPEGRDFAPSISKVVWERASGGISARARISIATL